MVAMSAMNGLVAVIYLKNIATIASIVTKPPARAASTLERSL
jgi:hypothetical protein